MAPNRIAVYVSGAGALATALAPAIANLDLTSTIGVVGGLLGLAAVVRKWLEGWQMYEERTHLGLPTDTTPEPASAPAGDVTPPVSPS